MAVPFRSGPDSPKQTSENDPFLEFDSERPDHRELDLLESRERERQERERQERERLEREARPTRSGLFGPAEPLIRSPLPDAVPAYMQPERPGRSAISPTVAFALGVAGLVTAIVAYYQLGQVLGRPAPVGTETTTVSAPASGTASLASAVGQLEIGSDPPGASVTIDGRARGVTPLTLSNVPAGRHTVVVTRGASIVNRSVNLGAGDTAVVFLGAATAPPPAIARLATPETPTGWVSFDAPINLRVLERGRQRGTSAARLALAPGGHELELVSDTYEFRQTVSVTVASGRSNRVAVAMPTGTLSINALPWADVWVDGAPVGTTPLANLSVSVGSHEVVLRHPTLGERQQTVLVKAKTPARVGVNLNR